MDKSQFDFWINYPFKQKQQDSLRKLGDLVRATCLRRTKDSIQDSLRIPQRIDRTEDINLHQSDQDLYEFFRAKTAKIAAGLSRPDEGRSRSNERRETNILTLINFLRRICNHGEDLLPQSALEAWKSNSMLVDWQMMRNCDRGCDSCGSPIESVDFLSKDTPEFDCQHSFCTMCYMQSEDTVTGEVQKCPKCAAMRVKSGNFLSPSESSIQLSAKLEALLRNVAAEQALERHQKGALPVKRYSLISLFETYMIVNLL